MNAGVFIFFFSFFAFKAFNSLKMANIGDLFYGVLGTAPKFGLREGIEFAPVFTSSKQRCKRKFTDVFVQVVKKSALNVHNFFFIYLLAWAYGPGGRPPNFGQ